MVIYTAGWATGPLVVITHEEVVAVVAGAAIIINASACITTGAEVVDGLYTICCTEKVGVIADVVAAHDVVAEVVLE